MSRGLRQIGINTAVAVGATLLSLWLLDVFIVRTQPITVSMQHAPATDYRLKPDLTYRLRTPEFEVLVRTNRHGLRGGEPDLERPCTVLLLGDSVTFGHGVADDETYAQQLQRKLDDAFPGTFTVINSGHNGYDSRREAAFFETYGVSFEPDLVSVAFVMNDPLSNSGDYQWSPIPLNVLRYLPFEGVATLLEYLRRNPRELLFHVGLLAEYEEVDHWTCLNEGACVEAWDATGEQLWRIKRQADALRIPLLLVNIPVYQQLPGATPPTPSDGSFPSRWLAALGAEMGVPLVDLYTEGNLGAEHYFPRDQHLRAAGHEIVASRLFDPVVALTERCRSSADPPGDA